ncbi:MAG: heme exporter protein CcmB [Alphaproteobacteria bacterium]|jgi:heme exporter protein B|nr:heme exporter protein CcmB [Alphaproteobacteria bacterium]MDP6255339.1 heme exporter protein CcmB [Alphaproteobacteria bacterium]MDP7053427.1 heme exporter protein CcmB [Alphaproteobacteria bacterium]MDP7229600.1 heme exporter protein CcmB [Alphaproteobacteria bacterium]MDP7462473.1 heme exporter protein CcmB [Alphaproteobacteria bacterium]|tara:strand:+ start:3214 stop:3879 length:666 start_codon:yes stop_codon:yes gene_type:complete
MKVFSAIIARDLLLAVRQGGATFLALVFFLLTVTLFPLGIGPEPAILARVAPGVLWVAALLAAMLSLDRLFQADFEDGSLEQLTLSGLPVSLIVLAKIVTHWLTTGLPLLLAAPVLAVLLNMNSEGFTALLLTMLIGTPALSLIGAIGAALTLTVRRGGVLLSLLVLPLYIPVLIFGVSAIDAAVHGLNAKPHLLLLAALTMAAIPLCPWAAAAAVKLSLE